MKCSVIMTSIWSSSNHFQLFQDLFFSSLCGCSRLPSRWSTLHPALVLILTGTCASWYSRTEGSSEILQAYSRSDCTCDFPNTSELPPACLSRSAPEVSHSESSSILWYSRTPGPSLLPDCPLGHRGRTSSDGLRISEYQRTLLSPGSNGTLCCLLDRMGL